MNIMIGHRAVILGSGDIGLIMARRLTLEGAEVAAVLEKLPYPGGLPRNIRQCLTDYQIPLLLSHTVTEVLGRRRVEAVRVSRLDDQGSPVPGTEQIIPCDALILSVGLIPENELSIEAGVVLDPATGGPKVDQRLHTNVPGVVACGNALHVHDLADYAAEEGARAGLAAARFAAGATMSALAPAPAPGAAFPQTAPTDADAPCIPVGAGQGIRYVLPQQIRFSGGTISSEGEAIPDTPPSGHLAGDTLTFFFRVQAPRSNARIFFRIRDQIIYSQSLPRVNPPEMLRAEIPLNKLTEPYPYESLEVYLDD
jgi:hypothetical protein